MAIGKHSVAIKRSFFRHLFCLLLPCRGASINVEIVRRDCAFNVFRNAAECSVVLVVNITSIVRLLELIIFLPIIQENEIVNWNSKAVEECEVKQNFGLEEAFERSRKNLAGCTLVKNYTVFFFHSAREFYSKRHTKWAIVYVAILSVPGISGTSVDMAAIETFLRIAVKEWTTRRSQQLFFLKNDSYRCGGLLYLKRSDDLQLSNYIFYCQRLFRGWALKLKILRLSSLRSFFSCLINLKMHGFVT